MNDDDDNDPIDWRERTRPALAEIRRLLKEAKMTQGKLEKEADFSDGYVSQLLGLNLDLKLKHVLVILAVLEVSPEDFFAQAYPRPKKGHRALDKFQRTSGPLVAEVDDLLTDLYERDFDSLEDLRRRLGRCEDVIAQIEASGILDEYRKREEG